MKLNDLLTKNMNSIYIIAEVGVNHEGNIETAMQLIDDAVEGGADAVKFQTYKAETLAIKDSPAYWDLNEESTKNQYELFSKFDNFNVEDYKILKNYCESKQIQFLSTPFDLASVDFLDPLVPFFKIASSDITNIPLIRKIASKRKPILLSTGASTIQEIELALKEAYAHGANEIGILHCILNYPTENIHANLGMITDLKQKFPNNLIGYSDHTIPDQNLIVLITSVLLGARIIEKHFTLDKTLKGNDHYHSMDKHDLRKFRQHLEKLKLIIGKEEKTFIESEIKSRINARRSLYYIRNLEKNHIVIENDLIALRPARGISPTEIDALIGKKLEYGVKALQEVHLKDFN